MQALLDKFSDLDWSYSFSLKNDSESSVAREVNSVLLWKINDLKKDLITKREKITQSKTFQMDDPAKTTFNSVKQLFRQIGKETLSEVEEVDFENCIKLGEDKSEISTFLVMLHEYCLNAKKINLKNCNLENMEIINAMNTARYLNFENKEKYKLKELDLSNNKATDVVLIKKHGTEPIQKHWIGDEKPTIKY